MSFMNIKFLLFGQQLPFVLFGRGFLGFFWWSVLGLGGFFAFFFFF